jgi:hypothetical protein
MAAAKKVAKKKKPSVRAGVLKKAKGTAPRTARKKASRPAARTSPRPRKKAASAFGRVKVPVDARLDLVFQKDYQAREIFDFLKVQTIRELEQFGPDEIIELLTGPMMQTLGRIRKTLALANRHLAKDEKFAKEFLAEVKRSS